MLTTITIDARYGEWFYIYEVTYEYKANNGARGRPRWESHTRRYLKREDAVKEETILKGYPYNRNVELHARIVYIK